MVAWLGEKEGYLLPSELVFLLPLLHTRVSSGFRIGRIRQVRSNTSNITPFKTNKMVINVREMFFRIPIVFSYFVTI